MDMEVPTRMSHERFRIDLNSVQDDNRVVTLMGYFRPQVVPLPGEWATAVDEDGAYYDAEVEAVMPDHRVYLRVYWASKRPGTPPLEVHGPPMWTAQPLTATH